MEHETSLFVNLPVKDLKRSQEFFGKLGFAFNPQFTDEKAACLILGKYNYAMLLTEEFFKTFSKKPIVDAGKSTEVIIAISVGSRAKVDEMVEQALKNGAKLFSENADLGFMYSRSFQDLDNHNWEVFYMEPSHVQ